MQIRLLTLLSIASWVSTEMADVSLGKVYQDLKSWAVYRLPAYALTNLSNNKPYHTFTIVLSHFVCTKFFSCHLLTSFLKLATTSHQYSTCRQMTREKIQTDKQFCTKIISQEQWNGVLTSCGGRALWWILVKSTWDWTISLFSLRAVRKSNFYTEFLTK